MAMSLLRFASLAALAALVAFVGLRSSSKTLLLPGWKAEEQGRMLTTRRWLDPKTVKLKNSQQDTDLASMRIVAFGTSKTWGAGLEDQNDSYIKLLSPEAVNMGLRATPADYPSLCLHSMIGDQVFDVIILEFSPNTGQHNDFDRLAKRLRARFPAAIIIHLPIFMLLNDVDYNGGPLQRYLLYKAVESPQDPAYYETILSLPNESLIFPARNNNLELYKQTMDSVGGYTIEFPSFEDDIRNLVIENTKYYSSKQHPWDFVHPNELGHEFIAHKIRRKVTQIFAAEPRDHSATHNWVGEDQCNSWFLSGNLTEDVLNITNMSLQKFNPEADGKWALEVDRMGGSFAVECLFPQCSIYLSYMAIGPDRLYPRVLVSVNDQEPKLIDPLLYDFHLSQIMLVGTMQEPGLVTITVKPIPEDVTSHLLFRITGVIRTPIVN